MGGMGRMNSKMGRCEPFGQPEPAHGQAERDADGEGQKVAEEGFLDADPRVLLKEHPVGACVGELGEKQLHHGGRRRQKRLRDKSHVHNQLPRQEEQRQRKERQKDQGALPVRLYLLILTHDSLACPATGTSFSRAWPRNVRLSGCDGLPFRRGRSSASGGPGMPRPPGVFHSRRAEHRRASRACSRRGAFP